MGATLRRLMGRREEHFPEIEYHHPSPSPHEIEYHHPSPHEIPIHHSPSSPSPSIHFEEIEYHHSHPSQSISIHQSISHSPSPELSKEKKEGAVYIGASTVDVKQSSCFNEAKERAKVPFLYHQVLECGYDGIDFTIEDHDITVRIPEGAVAEGEKIHFEVGVATYGPFAFSENSRPISPILWLCILDKDVHLKRDFMIILPHILTGLTTDKLGDHQVAFAKANHEDYTSEGGKMAYRFIQCEIQPFFASVEDKSYGILLSSHCCFYCIKAQQNPKLARDAGYCLARIESLTSEIESWKSEIYFVASFFLKSCVTAWKEQFSEEKGFRTLSCVEFKFNMDGTSHAYIKIVPQYSPQQCDIAMDPSRAEIKLSEIDFWMAMEPSTFDTMLLKHEVKTYPPNVKMTIIKKSNVTKVPVKITGCLNEGVLDMDIPLGLIWPLPSKLSKNGSQKVIMPDQKPRLKDAFQELLPVASDWQNIGTLLEVEAYVLDQIGYDVSGATNRLRAMLSKWRNQCDPSPTWRALADSVEHINPAKAKSMRDRFATQ